MQFKLTREYVDHLQEFIKEKRDKEVVELLGELHPADIAEIMDELSMEEARYIYLLLDGQKASDVLVEIPEDDRKEFLEVLPGEIIARQFIDYMDSDDATDVMGEMTEKKREEVLSYVKDVEQAGDIVDLLQYDEDTAGGMMATELVKVNENWTVQICLREISKQAEDVDEIYYVYVVDDDDFLKGILSLKKLILNPTSTRISNLYNPDVISVRTDVPDEEVAMVLTKYDLVALPVVDEIGRLKGRITFDDVLHVIREEADKDYQLATGITQDVEVSDSAWIQIKARLPWLLIGLLGGILGARVIGGFEGELAAFPAMAFFIPLIGAMGGNVGVQSSSIIVRGIASNSLLMSSVSSKLVKELGVALFNAVICSSLVLLYNTVNAASYALTLSVSTALFSVIISASLFGTFIPIMLHKMKIDPALATGPFITTTNDIFGLLIYMGIGRLMFSLFS